MRPLAVALLLLVGCRNCSRSDKPITQIVIDCLAQDQTMILTLTGELAPLLAGESPRWADFEARAKSAGVSIGGCVAADLLQQYLAPAPGNAAPSPELGVAARATMERLRVSFGGAQFVTQHGRL